MKTIVAIWNTGGKGKSTTILNLANLLISRPHNLIFCSQPDVTKLVIDFRLVIRIGENTIVLESQGDPNTHLEARLRDIETSFNPNIIICSTRTRGETVRAVENLARDFDYDTIWTSTYQVTHDFEVANIAKAEHLLDLLIRRRLI
ncbi:hypothetical protein D3C80_1293050 [compost metagenome]